MRPRFLLALATAALLALVVAPGAAADKVISEPGSDPGQTLNPGGLATHFETGRLYVADTDNNRIQVFDEDGVFVKAFGSKGSGPGQFEGPRSIAIDNSAAPSNNDVYVVDSGNNRIQRFGPEGEFKLAFGSEGTGEGQFNFEAGPVMVGVGPGGVVYVVDNLQAGSEFEYRLQTFDSSGVLVSPQRILVKYKFNARSIAVTSTGDLYVTPGNAKIDKYEADGTAIGEIEDAFEESPLVGVNGLAVDDEDHLFAVSSESASRLSVMEFDPAGNRVRRFGYGALSFGATAVGPVPSGAGVYVSEALGGSTQSSRVVRVDFPPPGPLVATPCTADPIGNSKATLKAAINPEGKATTYRFQYISEADFEANVDDFKDGFDGAASTPESAPLDANFKLARDDDPDGTGPEPLVLGPNAQATGLIPETDYRCRAIATNADAPAGNPGPEGSFETKAPLEILETGVSGVGAETATLNAELNPLGIPLTTGFFEYVTETAFQESGFATASKAPAGEPLDFGVGEAPVLRGTSLSGLDPATTYRYRLVATDSLISPKTVISPTKAFRTYVPGAGSLPDGRAYELVSPARKNSAEVAIPAAAGGLNNNEVSVRINAAAGSGEAVTYTSWTSFGEEAQGAPSSSQYLSKRGASGWGTENISARGFMKLPLTVPYRGFTADLGFGAFIVDEPALTPEAQEGFANLYLRDNQTGQIQALTIAEPQLTGSGGFCPGYAGASADGSRAIFAGRGALAGTGAPLGEGFSLYEWSAGGLALVSVLPNGEPAPPVPSSLDAGDGTGFGAAGSTCTMDQGIVRNAISADGSTIFWRYGGKYGAAKEPLFARIGGNETVQLDAKPEENAGKGPFGQGIFRAATPDGRFAFFTAPGKLTKDAEAAGHIYRYDTQSGELLDLTPGAIAPQVEGVVGTSEDGTYLYLGASGALTGEEENAAGQKAKAGAKNLYLWHQGEGLRFIATLALGDQDAWSPTPERLTGRVTPDGHHLAFFSRETEGLSGYDNRISPGTGCEPEYGSAENKLSGSPLCAEAYLYDADADSLACVSCNPSGSRPTGPSEVPGWTNPYEGPRYLSDDGSKLFFESRDVLSPADTNGKRDVYEYEIEGAGSCSDESPGFNPASGGCLTLITSGQSTDESFLVDASADGRDVFFSTRGTLTGWDTNENYDVYDARIGGGFPEPPPPPVPCAGEACPAPPNGAPAAPTAATPNFQGAGNPKTKKPGRKARGHKKKHKHQAKKRKGAGQRQRSGR